MRWIVPSKNGPVVRAYPDVFIALAEKIGVISEIYSFALHSGCKQAAEWMSNGTPLPVSVNVSVKQLQQDNFVPMVRDALELHQLDSSLLELEITESAAMHDFGTGYSSLNYLKRLPVDNLKIDRSFVTDIVGGVEEHSVDVSIVRSIIALGKSMEFGLIAEGIETDTQHEFLQSLDCDEGQGYLYAKPLSVTAINDLLTDNNRSDQPWQGWSADSMCKSA